MIQDHGHKDHQRRRQGNATKRAPNAPNAEFIQGLPDQTGGAGLFLHHKALEKRGDGRMEAARIRASTTWRGIEIVPMSTSTGRYGERMWLEQSFPAPRGLRQRSGQHPRADQHHRIQSPR